MRSVIGLLWGIVLLSLTGCGGYNWKIPGVYRIPVQQGAVIEQSMVNQLKPGMAKEQVRFIMGSPVIADPFHSNRWEYVYSFQEGNAVVREQRHITLHFDDDAKLAYVTGDIEVVDASLIPDTEPETRKQPESFVVPERSKPGFFGRIIGTGPSIEDEQPKAGDEESDSAGDRQRRTQENIEVIENPEDGDGL